MPALMGRGRRRGGGGGGGGRRRKRRRIHHSAIDQPGTANRKLLVGEKVEVRFSEWGLKGSWNPGVVTSCANCIRIVEYDEMLEEEGATKLVESISVSTAIEGLSKKAPKNHRGCIRPSPPRHDVDLMENMYGMCVDALVDDAWWEGVITDKKEGSSTRLVFFPDQGDQHVINTENMRLTFDWNEVSGDWKHRGCWVLFDLGQFPISIRQVWYLLSSTIAFHQKIGDWIFGSRSTWQELVSGVIEEAMSVSCGQAAEDDDLFIQFCDNSFALDNIGNGELERFLLKDDSWLSTFDENDSFKCISHGINIDENFSSASGRADKLEIPVNGVEAPLGPSDNVLIPEQGCHALMDFIGEYHNRSTPRSPLNKRRYKDARKTAKTHLLAMGWKFNGGPRNKRYVSPTGEQCFSFIKACERCAAVKVSDRETTSQTLVCMKHAKVKRKSADTNNEVRAAHRNHCSWQLEKIVGEYCPEAISNYRRFPKVGNVDTRSSTKKHLVALGWTIYHKLERSADRVVHRYRYHAPDGKSFYSLQTVCKNLMEEQKAKDHFRGGRDDEHNNPALEYQHREKFPEAVLDYVNCMELKRLKQVSGISNEEIRQKRFKAKAHLMSLGWTLWYTKKNDKKELRYSSPKDKSFISLLKACKAYLKEMKENENIDCAASIADRIPINNKLKFLSLGHDRGSREKSCSILQDNVCQSNDVTGKGSAFSSNLLQFGEQKSSKLQRGRTIKGTKRAKDTLLSSSFVDLHGRMQSCLSDYEDGQNSRKRKVAQPLIKHRHRSRTRVSRPVLLPCKRARRDLACFAGPHRPRTILSLLIDNNILQPREKVRYLNKRDKHVMMEGWITRDGVKCTCCKKLFSLSNFEIHSGSTNHRPSANIFLEDGRSLLECQKQMFDSIKPKHFPHRRVKGDFSDYLSDGICSICQDGGILVLCDHCPSSFHLNCVGLKDVPEGNWFCPSCKCSICGLSEFNSDTGKFTEDTKLYCDQCEREYHVGCLRKDGMQELEGCPKGFWFCSEICSKIFHHLRELVGKSNPTSVDGFSWTLLRSSNEIDNDFDKLDIETRTEHHSKLQVALDVLHECFVSIIEPRTGSDLVADLLYNKESELKRLDFWGFYTMVLEKEDEIVSVASFRVYGEKAAEMPLVGTRIQYRRRGMCRLLIDELEKLLFSFGVERLLLPAVPELLETWTNSFGFSRMTHSERMMLSEYMFLNFQGTTMCQKPVGLLKLPIRVEDRSKEFNKNQRDVSDISNDEVDYDSRAIETCCLHAEDVTLGEIGFQIDADLSSPVGSCLDPVGLTQDDEESQKDIVADDILTNVAPGECESSSILVETMPPIIMMKSPTSDDCMLITRQRNKLSGKIGSVNCLSKAFVGKTFGTYKYFYKRRIFAN